MTSLGQNVAGNRGRGRIDCTTINTHTPYAHRHTHTLIPLSLQTCKVSLCCHAPAHISPAHLFLLRSGCRGAFQINVKQEEQHMQGGRTKARPCFLGLSVCASLILNFCSQSIVLLFTWLFLSTHLILTLAPFSSESLQAAEGGRWREGASADWFPIRSL